MGKAKRPVKLADIQFDALLKQDDSYEAEIPDYPVESGLSVNDNVTVKPFYISAELYLSNTPITWNSRLGSSGNRVRTVERRLKAAFLTKEPLTYSTTDQTYNNMCIEAMTISKSEETGYARKIIVTLKQVTVTETKTGTIPDSYVRGGSTAASAGTASKTPATSAGVVNNSSTKSTKETSEKKSSMLYKATKGIGGGK